MVVNVLKHLQMKNKTKQANIKKQEKKKDGWGLTKGTKQVSSWISFFFMKHKHY